MPAFLDNFAHEVSRKRDRFVAGFDSQPKSEAEKTLRDQFLLHWNPLPNGPAPDARPTFAVDGSSAMRPLQNSGAFVVAQSVLIGRNVEETRLEVEMLRGGDVLAADRASDRLRQLCEYTVAAQNMDQMTGGILLLDGSLLAMLKHLLVYLRPAPLGDYPDLKASLVGALLSLMEGCKQRGILLASIAKSSRDTVLAEGLMGRPSGDARLCDGEILFRWPEPPRKMEAGFTSPIMLGADGVSNKQGIVQEANATDWSAYRERVAGLPCIAVFYIRFAPGEDALRVDVMGDGIDCDDTLMQFTRRWADPTMVAPLVQALRTQHGGPSVYNVPLYTADRVVRLSGKVVDSAYLSVLRHVTGEMVSFDRGTRRFHK